MKRIFVDLETTGLAPGCAGVHSIAALVEVDGTVVEEIDLQCRPFPTDEISDQALKVCGITADELQTYQEPHVQHKVLCSALGRHIDKFNRHDKALFLAYNAQFDAQHLRAWFRKCKDQYFGSWFWSPAIDIMSLAGEHLASARPQMSNFKLATVASQLGIDVDETATHGALYDTHLARSVYLAVRAGADA